VICASAEVGPRWVEGVHADLFNGQRGRCYYCLRHMAPIVDPAIRDSCTIDHKTPRYRGGPSGEWNLVAACYRCNQVKGYMTADEFLTSRAFRNIVGHDFVWSDPTLAFQ
jgi:5-methylcytosine-specific restriction endonuclease McrA